CVKHAASVRPEPGSNSPLKTLDWPAKPAISQRHRVKSLAKKTQTSKNTDHPTRGCETISNTHIQTMRDAPKKFGTDFHRHTVEFSKNTHTPSTPRNNLDLSGVLLD
ncbi:hypothetical protein, partial [Speluncibacter jeojiensis]|uniref:hypothetical protein n=1 Tax=Speluncibacter jeojiensis TaxID=2710754 RepID=UPI00240F5852